MNILYITIDSPWHDAHGGLASYYEDLIPEVLRRGHTVHIVSFLEEPGTEYESEFRDGVMIHTVNLADYGLIRQAANNTLAHLGHFTNNLPFILHGMYTAVQDILNTFHIDVIECDDGYGMPLITAWSDVPGLVRIHPASAPIRAVNSRVAEFSHIVDRWETWCMYTVERAGLRRNPKLVANSHATKDLIGNMFPMDMDIRVVYPPVRDLSAESIQVEYPFVLFYGRIEPRKDPMTAARAMRLVMSDRDEIHFVIAGSVSHAFEHILEEILDLLEPFQDRVHYVGDVARERVLRYVSVAECVVASSIWEPFGYVCAEPMMLGTPVIATAAGGFEEQIDKPRGNGFLFPPRDDEALADRIQHVLSLSPEERASVAEAARDRARRFRPERIADEMLEHYRDLVPG